MTNNAADSDAQTPNPLITDETRHLMHAAESIIEAAVKMAEALRAWSVALVAMAEALRETVEANDKQCS